MLGVLLIWPVVLAATLDVVIGTLQILAYSSGFTLRRYALLLEGRGREVVVLTRKGRDLIEANRIGRDSESRQTFYAGSGSPAS